MKAYLYTEHDQIHIDTAHYIKNELHSEEVFTKILNKQDFSEFKVIEPDSEIVFIFFDSIDSGIIKLIKDTRLNHPESIIFVVSSDSNVNKFRIAGTNYFLKNPGNPDTILNIILSIQLTYFSCKFKLSFNYIFEANNNCCKIEFNKKLKGYNITIKSPIYIKKLLHGFTFNEDGVTAFFPSFKNDFSDFNYYRFFMKRIMEINNRNNSGEYRFEELQNKLFNIEKPYIAI